jgi:hypothetical protein
MTHLQTNGSNLLADDDAADEVFARFVEQVQGRAVRFEQLRQLAENELEQVVEVEGRAERVADFTKGYADPLLAGQSSLELGDLRPQGLLVGVIGHVRRIEPRSGAGIYPGQSARSAAPAHHGRPNSPSSKAFSADKAALAQAVAPR